MKVQLKIVSGPMSGKEFTFNEHDVFIFGRSPDAHCCLPADPCVSRNHFMLEIIPPDSRLKDLGSLNGTYVNGKKYGGREANEKQEGAAKRSQTVEIKDGDELKVGNTTIQVMVEVEKAKAVPAKCVKCGKEIPAAIKEDLVHIGGSYLCRECRVKQIPPASPHRKEQAQNEGAEALEAILNAVFRKGDQEIPQIPGYEIIKKLGQGGFGAVYLVKRKSDRKELALKVMLSKKKSVTEKDVQRFQREMQICKELKHPNIITFEDQGYTNGFFYFTMEYCPGRGLHDLIEAKGGSMEVNDACSIMLQTLSGLSYAHEKGIVHRDLKPPNILFSDLNQKTAKITDFGLAKNFEQAGLSGFTVAGEYAGTLPFTPKEQITNFKYVKPVSDVFSIGATFYNMLTGNYVYDFKNNENSMKTVLEGKVVSITKRRSLPRKLSAVIDKAISPEADHRYQTAAEMKEALERAQN